MVRTRAGRHAQTRRPYALRPERREHDRLARLHPVQRDDDDLHQPGHPGQHRRRRHRRPADPEPCGKLGSHPRRQGLALQDPQGRRVLEREDPDHGRRCQLPQRASRRGHQVRGQGRVRRDQRRSGRGRRYRRRGSHRRQCRPALPVHRLPLQRRSDGGRQGRPALTPRNRLLPAARVQSGCAHGPGEEPERLAGERARLRGLGRDPRDPRRHVAGECARQRLRRRDQPSRPEDHRAA